MNALVAGRVVPVIGLDGAGDLAARLATRVRRARRPPHRPRARLAVRRDDERLGAAATTSSTATSRLPSSRGSLHRFLARLPALLRERGAPHQLIVTTNYDLALERAFEEAGEELDIVAYVATGRASRALLAPAARRAAAVRSTFRTRTRPSSRSSGGRSS